MTSNCLLSAEGIFLEDVSANNNTNLLDDTLFCVHLQRQYSAQRELQEFLLLNAPDKKGQSDPQSEKYYQALKVVL